MSITKKRKRDDELLVLFVIAFLGLGTLASVNIWYSDWVGMFDTWAHLGAIVGIVGVIAVVCISVIMFLKWNDPVYDKYRHYFWVGCLITIIYICGFKVAKKDRIESPTNQEQLQ